jgi:hypothetical protein
MLFYPEDFTQDELMARAQREKNDIHSIWFQTVGAMTAVVAAPTFLLLLGLAPFTALGFAVGGPFVLLGSASFIYGRLLRKKVTAALKTEAALEEGIVMKRAEDRAQMLAAAESALDQSLARVDPEIGLEIPVVLGSGASKRLCVEKIETKKILGNSGIVSKTEITARLYDGQELGRNSLMKGDPTPDMPVFRRMLQDKPPDPA